MVVGRYAHHRESLKSVRRDADTAVWKVPVPANGSATVTVTFETRI
jgi:hypothetical protein